MLTTRLRSRCCPPPPFLKFLLEYSCIGFPGGPEGKDSAGTAGDPGSIPGSGRLPWRRASQSTPIFLPGSHGQRSLAGYSLWGHKESDTTECSHNCSQPGSSAHGILQARILEWVAISSFQGIFPTQETNLDLLHCRQILYQLSYEGSPPYEVEILLIPLFYR